MKLGYFGHMACELGNHHVLGEVEQGDMSPLYLKPHGVGAKVSLQRRAHSALGPATGTS